MTRQVRCECGYTARGETDAEVIALVLAHVAADHPDLAGSGDRSRHPGAGSSYPRLTLPRWRGPSVLAVLLREELGANPS